MNILIVGNGFDLSHYLPTKYDHFMDVMSAIENWDIANGEMSFDDVFGSLYEKEDYFFGYTKAMYKTDEIKISVEQIIKLKKQLEKNVWYQYFSDHVRELKTWIDFETKIEEALVLVCKFINAINSNFENYGKFDNNIKTLTITNSGKNDDLYYLSSLDLKLLIKLELCNENSQYGQTQHSNGFSSMPDTRKAFISNFWYQVKDKAEYGFASKKYISYLNSQLEKFIIIFDQYLEVVVKELRPKMDFVVAESELMAIDKIYSFNYTNTYLRFYESGQDIDFLHGSTGEFQNVVLGISDLHNEALRKLKAYGFTKYHQKLLKDTDYQFLSENWHAIRLKSFWQSVKNGKAITLEDKEIYQMNIYIWGHSLDTSDEIYINEIFSFNTEFDEQVRVIVYYFNQIAKFDLLTNIIHILGKTKIEIWMKKGWLKFEPNPDITELNNIKPVELPKIVKA